MADIFDNAIKALPGLQVFWPLDDPAPTGTTNALAERSGNYLSDTNFWFPWNAARGTLGNPSIVPAVSSTCLHKIDSGSFQIVWSTLTTAQKAAIAQPGPLSFCCWVNLDSNVGDTNGNSNLWGQFFGWSATVNGETIVVAPPNFNSNRYIVPGITYFVSVSYDPGGLNVPAGGYIYINGAQVAFISSSSTVTWNTNALELGGVFGASGVFGYMQKVAWYSSAMTQAQWQSLYIIGNATAAETAGTQMQVYPWSRQIVPTNPLRHKLVLQNDSIAPMFLSLGDTTFPASATNGIYLAAGEEWKSSTWKGPIQAIHTAPLGSMILLVTEEQHA